MPYLIFKLFSWRNRPHRNLGRLTVEVPRPHSVTHTTLGRTPLDEGSARRRDLYVTTHSIHKTQISMAPGGIRTRNPNKREATGIGTFAIQEVIKFLVSYKNSSIHCSCFLFSPTFLTSFHCFLASQNKMPKSERHHVKQFCNWQNVINPLNPELNPICYLLALLGAHHFLHVSRIRVKSLTFRRLCHIYMEHPFLMFLDHTQRRSTVGRTPLDE